MSQFLPSCSMLNLLIPESSGLRYKPMKDKRYCTDLNEQNYASQKKLESPVHQQ